MHLAAVAVFALTMAYAGISDVSSYRIPNWISILIVAAFFPAAVGAGWDFAAMAIQFGAGVAVLIAGVALFALGIIGGGDAKLLAAGAVWAGWGELPAFLLLVALGGGVLGLALIAFRRARLPAAIEARAWARRLHEASSPAPYGVAIGMAALVLLPDLPLTTELTGWPAGG
jgi:prepilin peptidase CpaA